MIRRLNATFLEQDENWKSNNERKAEAEPELSRKWYYSFKRSKTTTTTTTTKMAATVRKIADKFIFRVKKEIERKRKRKKRLQRDSLTVSKRKEILITRALKKWLASFFFHSAYRTEKRIMNFVYWFSWLIIISQSKGGAWKTLGFHEAWTSDDVKNHQNVIKNPKKWRNSVKIIEEQSKFIH